MIADDEFTNETFIDQTERGVVQKVNESPAQEMLALFRLQFRLQFRLSQASVKMNLFRLMIGHQMPLIFIDCRISLALLFPNCNNSLVSGHHSGNMNGKPPGTCQLPTVISRPNLHTC